MPSNIIKSFNPGDGVLVVCGVPIENLSDDGISIEYLKPFSTGRTGVNGKGIRVDSVTRPVRLTINLMPASDEKSLLLNKWKSETFDGESAWTQIGTTEAIYMYGPIFENIDARTRKVQDAEQVGNDVITIMFMDSEEF